MARSHVLLETETDGDFSEALPAEVQAIFPDDGTVLTAAFAGAGTFPVFSHFLWFDLCHVSISLPLLFRNCSA